MPIKIHNKEYSTVAERVDTFRKKHPEWTIKSEIIDINQETVVILSSILNEEGRVISTGIAEEKRNSSQINRTSAAENCETSAVGRALAFFGLGGTEIASANEVQQAIHQQNIPTPQQPRKPLNIKVDDGVMDAFINVLRGSQNLATLKRNWQEGAGMLDGESLKLAEAVKNEMKGKLK